MRVLLSMYGGRGDVGPVVGPPVRLRVLGAEVRGCAPPDWAGLPAASSERRQPATRDVLDEGFARVGGAGDSNCHRSAKERGGAGVSDD